MNPQELYQQRKKTAEEIAQLVESGWSCCSDIGVAIPPGILNALGNQLVAGKVDNLRLHTLLDLFPLSPLSAEAAKGIVPVSWFSGGGLRTAVNEGRGDIMPCYYRDMPSLFRDYVEVDALFATVSPMDEEGWFTTGATASNSEALIQKAKRIYLEVNANMPTSVSGPKVHISQVTALCENTLPLPVTSAQEIDELSKTIAGYIAEEVCNEATIQFGIGAIPEAVGFGLKDKRDLGIHTELLTDCMVELVECGVVTNAKKPINTGKTVATLAFGSERIYKYIDKNPSVAMLPVDYVNNPATIAEHPNFISVNSGLEVDFFGQVCAESMGTRHVSGSGGQVDYVRGAVQSKGGKSFIAFPSTAKNDTISRITPTLSPGAIVTTSKNDVDHIVTEYGVAKLRGKTLSQRVKALISIAHPKFRDELTFAAKKQNILI